MWEPMIDENHFKRGSAKGNQMSQKASSSFGPISELSGENSPKKNLFPFIPVKKNAVSFVLSPVSQDISNQFVLVPSDSSQSTTYTTWKELKSEYVKKRSRVLFYVDRIIKLFENGTLGYFKQKNGTLKALIAPSDIRNLAMDGKDRIKLITKEKNYIFKFSSAEAAKEWHDSLKALMPSEQRTDHK